jgi:DNA-directed RNA polymerase subunit RPC12/RpoP
MSDQDKVFSYACLNCLTERHIKYKDPIKCVECGNRILRKLRSKNINQLEGR